MSSEQGITMKRKFGPGRFRLALLLLVGLLAGCGASDSAQPIGDTTSGDDGDGDTGTGDGDGTGSDGNGDTDPVVPNKAPVANAGLDQRALAGETVYLPGSGQDSDGTIASYEWAQVDGTAAIINNTSAATTTVLLPSVSAAEELSFSLTVTDNDGASHTDSVNISLFVEDDPAGNAKPQANAGIDQVVSTGTDVQLRGLGDDLDGLIVSYAWTQSDGPEVEVLNANTSQASFLAPEVDGAGTFTFVLTVTDDGGAQASDDISVEVFSLMTPPQNVVAAVEPDVITLTWDEVPGAETYDIYYALESFDAVSDHENYQLLVGGTLEQGVRTNRFELNTPSTINDYYFLITAIRADDESTPSDEISATNEVGYVVNATGLLNDTGLDTFANASVGGIQLPLSEFPGQDADYGRDQDASLVKAGAGSAGFDFIKVSSSGRTLSASDNFWDCVFDNRTGLLWEVKKAAGSTDAQASDSTFTWYFSDDRLTGARPGVESGGVCNLSTNCNTEAYVLAMNELELCGRTDWRVPTIVELKSIVDHGSDQPMIDEDYFPNTDTGSYWSSSTASNAELTREDIVDTNADFAWSVEFYDGLMRQESRAARVRVRVVSGGSGNE